MPNDASSTLPCYQFADLTLDLGRRRVTRGGGVIQLGKLTFEFLRVLVESAPNVVTHAKLAERVWDGRPVSPETMTQRVMMLRQALSDDAEQPRYIEVIRGQGCRLVPEVRYAGVRIRRRSGPRQRRVVAAGVGLAVLASIVFVLTFFSMPVSAPTPSVAVLPPENLSSDPEHAFFAAGMHEEIISRIATIKNLTVISRASTLQYAESTLSISEIAAELSVQAVMTSSVRFNGEQVRITAQLIDPENGTHLWLESYERELSDIFGIQSDIALNIASALAAELSVEEQRAIEKRPTDSPEAYALFVKATVTADFQECMDTLDDAIELDPEFGLAYAVKGAFAAWRLSGYTVDVLEGDWEGVALENATRALAIDPTLGVAYAAISAVHQANGRLIDAEEAIDRSFQLSPADQLVQFYFYRFKRAVGDYDDATRVAEYSVRVNPNSRQAHHQLGVSYRYARDYEKAVTSFRNAVELNPAIAEHHAGLAFAEVNLRNIDAATSELRLAERLWGDAVPLIRLPQMALAYSRLGLQDDARRLFVALEERERKEDVDDASWALAYMAIGDYDEGLLRLRAALDAPGPPTSLSSIKANLFRDPVLEEPRYKDLREKIGIL